LAAAAWRRRSARWGRELAGAAAAAWRWRGGGGSLAVAAWWQQLGGCSNYLANNNKTMWLYATNAAKELKNEEMLIHTSKHNNVPKQGLIVHTTQTDSPRKMISHALA
jgi:hypothetical protein